MKGKEQQLASEIKKLHYELSFEHDLNRRLAEQLRDCQKKCGVQPRKYKVEDVQLLNLGAYLQELFYIQPLLLAYEDKITKLQQFLSDLQADSKGFEQKIAQIVSENNFLRTELQSKCKVLLEREASGMNARYLKLENDNLKEKQDVIRAENEEFKRQLLKLRDELDVAVRDNSKALKNDQLNRQIDQSKDQLRQVQIKIMERDQELELLKQKLRNQQIVANDNQKRINDLQTQRARYLSENKLILQQLDGLKGMQQSSLQQLQGQIQSLKSQLRSSQRRQSQLFQKSLTFQSQLQSKSNTLHNTQLQLASLQGNNQNMLQMLQSYESKVAHQGKKMKKAEQELKQVVEKLAGLSKEKDLMEWKLEEKQQVLERRDCEYRSQRERLGKMYQERMEAMRATIRGEQEQLEEELSAAKSTIAALEAKVERLTKG